MFFEYLQTFCHLFVNLPYTAVGKDSSVGIVTALFIGQPEESCFFLFLLFCLTSLLIGEGFQRRS